ncbi:MAG: hypothetical protein R2932_00920 [Caldilineaceae bacterium]
MTRYQQVLKALNDCQAANLDLLAEREHLRTRADLLSRENALLRRQLRERAARPGSYGGRSMRLNTWLCCTSPASQPAGQSAYTTA